MTSKLTRGPLFAEVHNVPDDYHFTAEELDRIIAGDMFTPRQGAIMAREIQERRKAEQDSEPKRNPVLAYADSYRDMAKQGVESVPIWSVITDLERNIALLYRHAQQPVVPKDHQIRELVNQLRDIAIEYHGTQQLRERIARVLRAAMLNGGKS